MLSLRHCKAVKVPSRAASRFADIPLASQSLPTALVTRVRGRGRNPRGEKKTGMAAEEEEEEESLGSTERACSLLSG